MQEDLDRLMANRNIDALLVSGGTRDNPSMYYLTNGAQVGEATLLIKKRESPAVIIAIGMEREEAEKSGLTVIDRTRYKWTQLIHEESGDYLMASVRMLTAIFRDMQVTGNVGVYGRVEQAQTLLVFEELQAALPEINFFGEAEPNVLQQAQQTKGSEEISRIHQVTTSAISIISDTREFLASHSAENGTLVTARGTPLTVYDVKREICRWTFEQNMELPQGMIFSVGRDSAIPHSRGEDDAPLELGRTIVFDYIPSEAGGGYFCDFTCTWCLGYAPPEIEQVYQDVYAALQLASSTLRAGQPCGEAQSEVNSFFEARGHPTTRSSPGTREGYVHSLGHGVGLSLHEYPRLSDTSGKEDQLQPGTVFTIEPGLYYPDQGYGVRIEDMFWIDSESGDSEQFGALDRDLVIAI